MKDKLRDRFAHFAANWILVHFASIEYLSALYEVNRLGLIEYRPRNPRLQPWGGKGAQALRWFATYCLMIPSGAPPTVATK